MSKSKEVTRHKLQKGRYLVKIGETFYLETCKDGQQRRRTLGTSDLNEAMKLQAKLETAEDELPQVVAPEKPKRIPVLTLKAALTEYEKWYQENRREREAERVVQVIGTFNESIGEETETKLVAREHVQKWVDVRKDGRSPITVRGDFARLRAFLYWLAKRKDAVNPNCCRGVDLPKDDGTTKEAPSRDKIQAVLAKLRAHPWLADFCTVLAEGGMRPTELLGARGVDLKGKLLTITPWGDHKLKSKWSKRTIELNGAAAEILARRKDQMFKKELPLFPNQVGDVYEERSVFHLFQDVLGGGKLQPVPEALKVTLYDFRHFFCSEHAAPGAQHMAIESLAAYIGHSPASTGTLLRWYTDQNALRRGAPAQLTEQKEGKVVGMGR